MNHFIRSAIIAPLIAVVLSTVLGGCAIQENRQRSALLSLPYYDFVQTYGSGFRVLYDRGEYSKSVVLIEDYLRAHRELTPGQQNLLHWHAAQLLALADRRTLAVQQLAQASWHEKTDKAGTNWNDRVVEFRAFLMHDRPALLAASERLAAAGAPQHVDFLVENFGSSYIDALLWHRLCPKVGIPANASPKHRASAEKLAKAFGFPSAETQTTPPADCIWLELRPFDPNPFGGYVIIHSREGTIITASDQHWLDDAVDRFIKSARERNGHYEARFGLATSFDVPR